MKQVSTLIGKQTSEDIKSVADKEFKTSNKNGIETLKLTDNINFTKSGQNYNGELYFDDQGNLVNNRSRYTMEIKLDPKTTEDGIISLDEASNDENPEVDNHTVYIVCANGQAKAVEAKPSNPSNIGTDQTIDIKLEGDSLNSEIITESNTLAHDFNKSKIQITIDLKYCMKNVQINVTNETKAPLNLCMLNKNVSEIKVVNDKGILNEYYRSDAGNKKGILYDVLMTIKDENNTVFKTSFVQNFDIK